MSRLNGRITSKSTLTDHVDLNLSIRAGRRAGRRAGCRASPTRREALEFAYSHSILLRFLCCPFVSTPGHVDIIVVEDSEVLPVSASLGVLHVVNEIAVDLRMTKP